MSVEHPRGGIVVMSGSWRRGSFSVGLLRRAEVLAAGNHHLQSVRIHPEQLPHYDADTESGRLPTIVREARDSVSAARFAIICTPEYNGAPPGALQNTLDWLSRPWMASPLTGLPTGVISNAPGRGGGRRALDKLVDMLELIGATVVRPVVCMPTVDEQWLAEPSGAQRCAADAPITALLDELVAVTSHGSTTAPAAGGSARPAKCLQ